MTTTTAAAVKMAAKVYNAAFPEAAAEIETGEAVVRVTAVGARGPSGKVRFTATAGVATPDGFIAAGEPVTACFAPRRGEAYSKAAVWFARKTFGDTLPVAVA